MFGFTEARTDIPKTRWPSHFFSSLLPPVCPVPNDIFFPCAAARFSCFSSIFFFCSALLRSVERVFFFFAARLRRQNAGIILPTPRQQSNKMQSSGQQNDSQQKRHPSGENNKIKREIERTREREREGGKKKRKTRECDMEMKRVFERRASVGDTDAWLHARRLKLEHRAYI